MQDPSDFIFINMANVTLLRHDSYLDFVRHGVKVDTVVAFGNSPLHMTSLFPDDAEEEIGHHEDKQCTGGSKKKFFMSRERNVWSVHCSNKINDGSQRNQSDGSKQGYKNPPGPRQFIG